MSSHQSNNDPSYAAALFYATLATGLAKWLEQSARQYGLTHIAFGGGCFHNEILLRSLTDKLMSAPLQVLSARQMQPDDSVIALGQAWVAIQKTMAN